MKKLLIIVVTMLAIASCVGSGLDIKRTAERYASQYFPNYGQIIAYHIDTVTLGDNLAYRKERAQENLRRDESLYDLNKKSPYPLKSALDEEAKRIDRDKRWLAALDSLEAANADILHQVTAYTCHFNFVTGNTAWVQLDKDGNPLLITDSREKVFFNPGEDVPGYYEVWKKLYDELMSPAE